MDKQREELKDCPWCGRKPLLNLMKKTHCQLHGEPMQDINLKCCNMVNAIFRDKESAIKAWNTRPKPKDKCELCNGEGVYYCNQKTIVCGCSKNKELKDRCPTCGSKVRIEGHTTKYYVPEDKELEERILELLGEAGHKQLTYRQLAQFLVKAGLTFKEVGE